MNDFEAVFETLIDLGVETELSDEKCEQLRWNTNGFRCFNKPEPPTFKELAIEQYAA